MKPQFASLMISTGSDSPCTVAGASCASTPGSCPGLGVPALLAGNRLALAGRQGFCAADELYLRQQGGCLSSSAAARRLLASQADDSEDVAAWLEQQISMRQGARGASCNIDGPGTPEIAGVEAARLICSAAESAAEAE
ncbi:hypothetical protein OEZ85_001662 [Tetradesmus obliquus]|uniref:Uncharacterized protein n=1 Tax=Tetradesmus obliquus TaxID=3088 RepID=A0ABY8U0H6_TETOB|nr:hypothetical protein OEZ85_001662 [Tetradesmus obliquus]